MSRSFATPSAMLVFRLHACIRSLTNFARMSGTRQDAAAECLMLLYGGPFAEPVSISDGTAGAYYVRPRRVARVADKSGWRSAFIGG